MQEDRILHGMMKVHTEGKRQRERLEKPGRAF